MKPSIFTLFNESVDPVLDDYLNRCLDSGLKWVSHNNKSFNLEILFNNGIYSSMWNSNKYYSWLSSGNIGDYGWRGARPKRKTMRRLNKMLIKYFSENQ